MLRASVLALVLALAANGIAHAQTERSQAERPATGEQDDYSIAALQRALQAAGYDPGQIDGAVDDRTRQAIIDYQLDEGLRATGQPSPGLFARLTGEHGGEAAALAHRPAPAPDLGRLPQGGSDALVDIPAPAGEIAQDPQQPGR